MISCIENSLFLYRKLPQSRLTGVYGAVTYMCPVCACLVCV